MINSNLGKILNFNQLFELSLTDDLIGIHIEGETKIIVKNRSFISEYTENMLNVNELPVNSFVNPPFNPRYSQIKCFTYFSALKNYWNSFRFGLKRINILI